MGQFSIVGTADTPAVSPTLSSAAVSYAENVRKVSRATLERLGVGSGTVFFPELERKSEAVIFPYRTDGDVVNWKAAAIPAESLYVEEGRDASVLEYRARTRGEDPLHHGRRVGRGLPD